RSSAASPCACGSTASCTTSSRRRGTCTPGSRRASRSWRASTSRGAALPRTAASRRGGAGAPPPSPSRSSPARQSTPPKPAPFPLSLHAALPISFERSLAVRLRVDGVLHDLLAPPRHLHAGLASRVKIMAGLDIAERRLPQDGRIALRVGGRDVDVRVSIVP